MSQRRINKGHHQLVLTSSYYGSTSTVSVKIFLLEPFIFECFLEIDKTSLT